MISQPGVPVARMTTPDQFVAALPLWMGYTPSESLVVVCCHEPRGRVGMTMRFDLPPADKEELFVGEVIRRARDQKPTRLMLAVYTEAPDGPVKPRQAMIDALVEEFDDLVLTEVLLIRDGRFWSYTCHSTRCCPTDGTAVTKGAQSAPVTMIQSEMIMNGKVQLADREELEKSLSGPTFLAAAVFRQNCEIAVGLMRLNEEGQGRAAMVHGAVDLWRSAVAKFAAPPVDLGAIEAATLAVSLSDVLVRDRVAAIYADDAHDVIRLLHELIRRTPPPFDAPVLTLFAWMTYANGGGAAVTIALERALKSDPDYSMAGLLMHGLHHQFTPENIRDISRATADQLDVHENRIVRQPLKPRRRRAS